MEKHIAMRRLYMGAGQHIDRGDEVTDLSPAELERLKASGAVREGKAERPPANKAAPKPDNKADASDDKPGTRKASK